MSVANFDGYSQFEDWCIGNEYDPGMQYDEEEESHKRSTILSFYVKKNDEDVYAEVVVDTDYDNGWGYGSIERVGLKRIEKEVVVKQVSYE